MKKSTIGAIILVVIGGVLVLTYRWLSPMLFEWNQNRTSDGSTKLGTLTIGGDNFVGYWFLTSPDMRKACAREGLQIQFEDDGGLYENRLQAFQSGQLDAIVLPIASYLQFGAAHKFPGVVVASISESKGADGMLASSNLQNISDLNNAELNIVYTADSPSSFLLDLTIADFDLNELQSSQNWRVETEGSRQVLDKAKKGEGDVFILWEPDLSKAEKLPGMNKLWGSEGFSGYIIDVLVVNRNVLEKRKQALDVFLKNYFRTLDAYARNPEKMKKEMSRSTELNTDEISKTIEKIDWFDLWENGQYQFGIQTKVGQPAKDGLISAILACTDVLMRTQKVSSDPLSGNPYLITHSSLIENLLKTETPKLVTSNSGPVTFEPLDENGWAAMREVGVFRVEPITFQSWNHQLTDEGKETVDKIATLLTTNYPQYRIAVRGHTPPGGDEAENQKLSLERSQAVVQYLKAVHQIDSNRLLPQGLGSSMPPVRKSNESQRAYMYRHSRVEFVALEGNAI